MSFTSDIKEELSKNISSARHCRIAEVAAIISLCGRILISAKDHYCIKIQTENIAVARKYFTLLKKTFNISTSVLIRQNMSLKNRRLYVITIEDHEDSLKVLTECYVEKFLSEAKPYDYLQFQRIGYFNVDKDSTPEHLVFNRTVTLKDTWAKINK